MEARQIEGYQRMSPAEKLRLASLWLDRQTMIKVFGWDPKREGS